MADKTQWAIWRDGQFEAKVLVLYRHPHASDVYRVEGVHGESYANVKQLEFL